MFTSAGKIQGIAKGKDPFMSAVTLLLNWPGAASDPLPTVDQSGKNRVISNVGSMVQAGGNLVNFNGTNQAILVTAAAVAAMTGDFCIEAFVNPHLLSPDAGIISSGTFTTADDYKMITSSGNKFALLPDGTQPGLFYVSGAQSVDVQVHLCATRISNVVRFYINGTQPSGTSPAAFAGTKGSATKALRIGNIQSDTAWFNGKMGPIRVTSGTARYPAASFTPPPFGPFPTS